MKHLNRIALVALAVSCISGCSRDFSNTSYTSHEVGEATEVFTGTIIDVKIVKISEKNRTADNSTGMFTGALTGAVLGSMVGGGHGSTAVATAGALAGGLIGAAAEDNMSTQKGAQYFVKLESENPTYNNRIVTVVQGVKPLLQKGQRVYVSWPRGFGVGRARVTAIDL